MSSRIDVKDDNDQESTLGLLAICLLAAVMVVIAALEAMISPALPLIQRQLNVNPAQASLLTSTLVISSAVSTPIAGKLGDRFGGRKVFVWLSMVTFIGGAVSALAPSLPLLLVGQFLQGAGVGILPLVFILVRQHLDPGRAKAAVGIFTGMLTAGAAAGILLAGPIAEGLSRHWMFGVPTVVLGFVAVAAIKVIPSDVPKRIAAAELDWVGALLFAVGLTSLMIALSFLSTSRTLGVLPLALIVVAAFILVIWILVEKRAPEPFIDLAMISERVVRAGSFVAFATGSGVAITGFLIPQLLAFPASTSFGFGASSTQIGIYILPGLLISVIAAPTAGFADRVLGSRMVVFIGVVTTALALFILCWFHSELWQIIVFYMIFCIGVSALMTALFNAIISEVTELQTGVATGMITVARSLGLAMGVAAAALVQTAGTDPSTGIPNATVFGVGFGIGGGLVALSLLMTPFFRGRTMETAAEVSNEDGAHGRLA